MLYKGDLRISFCCYFIFVCLFCYVLVQNIRALVQGFEWLEILGLKCFNKYSLIHKQKNKFCFCIPTCHQKFQPVWLLRVQYFDPYHCSQVDPQLHFQFQFQSIKVCRMIIWHRSYKVNLRVPLLIFRVLIWKKKSSS